MIQKSNEIRCKYCNKILSDMLGLINHNCEKIKLRDFWISNKIKK